MRPIIPAAALFMALTACTDTTAPSAVDARHAPDHAARTIVAPDAATLACTGTIQTVTVPEGVSQVAITAVGGQGGGASNAFGDLPGGKGAVVTGVFQVASGDQLRVLVGCQGLKTPVGGIGGGGSFIWQGTTAVSAANILVAAGGGGGTASRDDGSTSSASPWMRGGFGNGVGGGDGGNNGLGGEAGVGGGGAGGAGIIGSGADASGVTALLARGGTAISQGGAAGLSTYGLNDPGPHYGFGGGGAPSGGGGGGGGYSGGGGGAPDFAGGAGGSYVSTDLCQFAQRYPTSCLSPGVGTGVGNGSVTLTWIVVQATTSVTVVSSRNPSSVGEQVTLTATVAGSGNPSGSVAFMRGGSVLCHALLTGGIAACTEFFMTASTFDITAVYEGDTFNRGSTSAPISQTVRWQTAVGIVASQTTFAAGQPVTFTATVTGGSSATGTVDFNTSGGVPLPGCAARPLSEGVATCTFVYTNAGGHSVTAVYSGDQLDFGGTSATLTLSALNLPPGGGLVTLTESGGSVSTADGAAIATAPAGAAPSGTVVQAYPVIAPANAPSGFSIGGQVFEFTATAANGSAITTFSQPITLTFSYTGTPPSQVDYYDVASHSWVALPGPVVVDAVAHTVSVSTTHIAVFAPLVLLAVPTTTMTSFGPGPFVYKGTAFTATATVSPSGAGSAIISYTGDCTNVGSTCRATASYAGDATHQGSGASTSITIVPAQVTATAGSGSGTYTGTTQSPAACAVTGVYTGNLTCMNNPAAVGPGVGTTVTAPVISGDTRNFVVTMVNGSFRITDGTPPLIAADVSGALGNSGWYTSDVSVTWTVTDGESAISAQNGCGAAVVSTDTQSVTFTCSATSAGGSSSKSVTIKRDASAPVIAFSGATSYTVDQTVAITCTASDPTSGVTSQCSGKSGNAYDFNIGDNAFTTSATNGAGFTAQTTKHYTVALTADAMSALITRFVSGKSVKTLTDRMANIADKAAKGNPAVDSQVKNFLKELDGAQQAGDITPANAAVLARLVQLFH